MSEFRAAMGLCILDKIRNVKPQWERVWHYYEDHLVDTIQFQKWNSSSKNNYCYAPILTNLKKQLNNIGNTLLDNNVFSTRYFTPPLDTVLTFGPGSGEFHPDLCLNSHNILSRLLCLPIYLQFKEDSVKCIAEIVHSAARMS